MQNHFLLTMKADRWQIEVLSDDAAGVGDSEWKQPLPHPHGSVNKPTSLFHWPVVSAWDGCAGWGGGGGWVQK